MNFCKSRVTDSHKSMELKVLIKHNVTSFLIISMVKLFKKFKVRLYEKEIDNKC